MPDYLPEDEATLHALGELTDSERRDFEARLEESAELRALVHELEEGAVALSMASPPRRPPRQVWERIETAVTKGQRGKPAILEIWTGWWRNGWAAAAACLIGWLLYGLWVNHADTPEASTAGMVSLTESPTEHLSASNPSTGIEHNKPAPPPPANSDAVVQLMQARAREVVALRQQLTELTNKVDGLSNVLRQQQALLAEPDRIKFLQLATTSNGSPVTAATPVSTNLQRALFLAMARELGWLPASSLTEAAAPGGSQSGQISGPAITTTNQAGVDFVDLRPDSGGVLKPTPNVKTETENTDTADAPMLAEASLHIVPGLMTANNAIFAFDTSVAPEGSEIEFWSTSADGQFQFQGTSVLGNNPMVVTIPTTSLFYDGATLTIIATTPSGSVSTIGQVHSPIVPSP